MRKLHKRLEIIDKIFSLLQEIRFDETTYRHVNGFNEGRDFLEQAQFINHLRILQQAREIAFGRDLSGDLAWKVILELFNAEIDGSEIYVSDLFAFIKCSQTSVLRCLAKLERSLLIKRKADLIDRRRRLVSLTETAHLAMKSILNNSPIIKLHRQNRVYFSLA